MKDWIETCAILAGLIAASLIALVVAALALLPYVVLAVGLFAGLRYLGWI